ncbi:MAG: NAD+ synthase [Acidilobaceae archaeon]
MKRLTAEVLRRAPDYESLINYLSNFLREALAKAEKKGYVVGLSGGVDSSTLYALAVRAVGVERVVPVIIPDVEATPPEDLEDARELVESLGGKLLVVELNPIVDIYVRVLERLGGVPDRLSLGNLKARVRMTILYYLANRFEMMVLGATDRTELLLGYFTKYGDGASDVAPLAIVYKTQVRELARKLGVSDKIASKPSAPRLWKGHTAEEELGLSFEVIDPILFSYVDLKASEEVTSEITGFSLDLVKRVTSMIERSRHKRELPKTPRPDLVVEAVKKSLELSE